MFGESWSIIGPKVAPEIFDFNPDDLVPSHMPDEMLGSQFPNNASMYSRLERARWFAKNIRLISVPNTLLKITQLQRQLMMLQLKKGGAPISWATIMKDLDIQNWGESEGNTEKEKWFNEEVEMQKLKIIAAALAQQFMKQMGIQPPEQEGGAGAGKGQGKGGGRPSTGQKGPRIAQKGAAGGEPRTVVKES